MPIFLIIDEILTIWCSNTLNGYSASTIEFDGILLDSKLWQNCCFVLDPWLDLRVNALMHIKDWMSKYHWNGLKVSLIPTSLSVITANLKFNRLKLIWNYFWKNPPPIMILQDLTSRLIPKFSKKIEWELAFWAVQSIWVQ